MTVSTRKAKLVCARFCHIRNQEQDGDFLLNIRHHWGFWWAWGTTIEDRKKLCEKLVKDGVFVRREDGVYSLKRKFPATVLRALFFKISDFFLKAGQYF